MEQTTASIAELLKRVNQPLPSDVYTALQKGLANLDADLSMTLETAYRYALTALTLGRSDKMAIYLTPNGNLWVTPSLALPNRYKLVLALWGVRNDDQDPEYPTPLIDIFPIASTEVAIKDFTDRGMQAIYTTYTTIAYDYRSSITLPLTQLDR